MPVEDGGAPLVVTVLPRYGLEKSSLGPAACAFPMVVVLFFFFGSFVLSLLCREGKGVLLFFFFVTQFELCSNKQKKDTVVVMVQWKL